MPSTPYVQALVAKNGGAAVAGAITAAVGDVLQLSAASTVGWQNVQWELYATVAMSTPTGWTLDANGSITGFPGAFYYAASGSSYSPPPFTIPAWGKFIWIARINGGITGDPNENLTDATGGADVASTHGSHDIALFENGQFGPWTAAISKTFHALDALAGTGGGSVPTGSGYVHITAGAQDGAAVAINLAGGAAYVSGILPSANQAAQAMAGAVGGTTAASAINLTGNASITGVLPAANQAAQTMGGDTTGTTASSTNAKLQGVAVSISAPSVGQFLVASSGPTWSPTTLSGDISASTSIAGQLTVTALSDTAAIPVTGPGFLFAAAQGAPKIGQTASTSASGVNLTVAAQSTTFSGGNGGSLNLSAGTGAGAGAAGSINFQSGATTFLSALASGGLSFAASASTPGPTISQASTTAATAQSIYLSPSASTATNGTPGGVVVALQAKTGTGAEGYFQVTHAGLSYPVLQVGCHPSSTSYGDIWLNPTTTPTANNYSFLCDGSNLNINAPINTGSVIFSSGNGATTLSVSTSAITIGSPIIGSVSASSIYSVHGYVATSTSGTVAAAVFTNSVISISAAGTYALPATAGVWKIVRNTSAGTVTITPSSGSALTIATNTSALIACDGTNWFHASANTAA